MKKLGSLLGRTVLLGGLLTTMAAPQSIAQSEPEPEPNVVTIKMIDQGGGQWRFDPESVTVTVGDLLRFVQEDMAPHNVEFDKIPDEAELGDIMMGPFLTRKGQTYDILIDGRFARGKYEYVCTPHAALGMTGEITVRLSDTPSVSK